MKTYKRLRLRIIWLTVFLFIAAAILFAALYYLLHGAVIAALVSGGIFVLGALGLVIFYGNVRLEIEVGRLRYYKLGKLRGNYFLSTCKFRTHIDCRYNRAGEIAGRPELELFVSDVSDYSGDEVRLDCTPIGLAQFQDLVDSLRHYYESTAAERERAKNQRK